MYEELLTLLEESIDELAQKGEQGFEDVLIKLAKSIQSLAKRQYQPDE
jgi:hypothetical protein